MVLNIPVLPDGHAHGEPKCCSLKSMKRQCELEIFQSDPRVECTKSSINSKRTKIMDRKKSKRHISIQSTSYCYLYSLILEQR
jgi:hypothetical protein